MHSARRADGSRSPVGHQRSTSQAPVSAQHQHASHRHHLHPSVTPRKRSASRLIHHHPSSPGEASTRRPPDGVNLLPPTPRVATPAASQHHDPNTASTLTPSACGERPQRSPSVLALHPSRRLPCTGISLTLRPSGVHVLRRDGVAPSSRPNLPGSTTLTCYARCTSIPAVRQSPHQRLLVALNELLLQSLLEPPHHAHSRLGPKILRSAMPSSSQAVPARRVALSIWGVTTQRWSFLRSRLRRKHSRRLARGFKRRLARRLEWRRNGSSRDALQGGFRERQRAGVAGAPAGEHRGALRGVSSAGWRDSFPAASEGDSEAEPMCTVLAPDCVASPAAG